MMENVPKIGQKIRHVVFDHDGTLVDVSRSRNLFDGIDQLLEELDLKGVKLYVWTARTRYSTVEFLSSLGIISRFEQLHCSTDGEPKPCVEGLVEMLEQADPGSVAVVGDSFSDMVGAKNYGAYAIGALWDSPKQDKHRRAELLRECGADYLAESVEECKLKLFSFIE